MTENKINSLYQYKAFLIRRCKPLIILDDLNFLTYLESFELLINQELFLKQLSLINFLLLPHCDCSTCLQLLYFDEGQLTL